MRLSKVFLSYYRSVVDQQFEIAPFTVLFGKNNAGKTNLLEAMYGVFAPQDLPTGPMPEGVLRGQGDPDVATAGVVYADLERGLAFDDAVLAMVPTFHFSADDLLRLCELSTDQVCFASTDRGSELWFVDIAEYIERSGGSWFLLPHHESDLYDVDEECRSTQGPRPRPLFLGWDSDDVDRAVTVAIAKLTSEYIYEYLLNEGGTWTISTDLRNRLDQLGSLASSLLPDFISGDFQARVELPRDWTSTAMVETTFQERGAGEAHPIGAFGRGASRWLGIALQIALRIMESDSETENLNDAVRKQFSGHVLFIDEPEAHLHPSAVASVIRWCQNLVLRGFNIVVASHHEEFLRATGEDLGFVEVTRGRDLNTRARSIVGADIAVLQQLADDVGLHPATALSLQRAILFVEGTLDQAVLEEYAPELEAAGVKVIPIHGTKNLEGLIDGEFTMRLGIKTGVLTDNTNVATIWDRSNRKRSGEEVKLVRLIQRFEEQGVLPPTPFGIPEDDLLFALPPDAIRSFLGGPFPGWSELRDECRRAEGSGPSDSVDWKSYAQLHYGLPITTVDGVKSLVRSLGLAGVDFPSVRTVVNEILDWAQD